MNYVKKYKEIIKIFLLALLFAFLAEYVLKAKSTISVNTLNEFKTNSGGVKATSEELQSGIIKINDRANIVELKVTDLNYNYINVKLFVSGDGETFADDQYVTVKCYSNQKEYFVVMNMDIKAIKVVYGDSPDDSLVLKKVVINPSKLQAFFAVIWNISITRLIIFLTLFMIAMLIFVYKMRFIEFVYKYRWQIGVFFIFYCTVLKLQGSSLGILAERIGGKDVSNLFGTKRLIRTDEWAVFSEMAFSQTKSGFNYFSDLWGYSPRDMFILYGQPVLNLLTIFRPFSIGYILFGAEAGLSFYWSSRMIIGLLVSFEFGMLITKDKKKLSVVYSLLVMLAPIVQWWYSINELVEMLIFGQLAVILIDKYLKTDSIKRKLAIAAGLVLCAGGYILAFYPAWMVTFIYAFLGCALYVIIDNRKNIHLKWKDAVIIGGALVVLGLALMYMYSNSKETIEAVMNTAYPGKRVYTGGNSNSLLKLFTGWSSYLMSVLEVGNPYAVLDFVSFFPLGFILSLIVNFRDKRRDALLIILNSISILLIVYMTFNMPGIVARLTLLKYTIDIRLINAIAFINIIILIRAVAVVKFDKLLPMILVPSSVIATYICFMTADDYYSRSMKIVIVIVSILFSYYFATANDKNSSNNLLIITLILGMVGGFVVNPVNKGLDSVYKSELIVNIDRINNEEEGTWIVCEDCFIANIPTIVGAKSLSALQTYPDKAFWEKLGLMEREPVWNRYLHLNVYVADSTGIELTSDDSANLYVTVDDMKNLDVKYVISQTDYSNYSGLEKIYEYDDFKIWKVIGE